MYKRVISFTKPQNEWLKNESNRLGISAAELVRRVVDWYRGERPGDNQMLDIDLSADTKEE